MNIGVFWRTSAFCSRDLVMPLPIIADWRLAAVDPTLHRIKELSPETIVQGPR
jgi:hypothetical protein